MTGASGVRIRFFEERAEGNHRLFCRIYRTYRSGEYLEGTGNTYKMPLEKPNEEVGHTGPGAGTSLKGSFFWNFRRAIQNCKKQSWLREVMRWQQFRPHHRKGPGGHRSISYNRLLSLNVIGADLDLAAVPVANFHRFNAYRSGSGRIRA